MTAATSNGWIYSSRTNPCPVCGRIKDGDCRTSSAGDQVICHHPRRLRPGELENGWAFTRNTDDGRAAHFVRDKPRESSRPTASKVVPIRRPTPAAKPPAPAPIAGPIVLARLPEGVGLPDLDRERAAYVYGPTQETRREPDGKGGKKIGPFVWGPAHPEGCERVRRKAQERGRKEPDCSTWIRDGGDEPWSLYQQALALEADGWVVELEGERCVALAMAAGLVAISQPGHNHTPAAITARYAVLAAAGKGVVYVADNDEEGERKATVCAAAAAAVGMPFLRLFASDVWPGIPKKGSIDDAPDSPADQVLALEEAANRAAAAAARVPATTEESPDPATVAQQELREAVADGISSADMEGLLASLAQRTKLNPYNLRQMAEALQAEGQGVERVTAEAERLQNRIDQQQAGQALTLGYLFPAPIAEALELRTRYLPADPCAVAALFLPSIASLQKIGSRITGSPASGFTVPLNCWGGIVAKSGQKKTPLLGKVVRDPTATIRQELAEGNRRDHQQWQEAQKPRGKGDKAEPKTPQPQPVHLHVGDVTAEALAALLVTLAERGRGVLVLRDELAGLFSGLDQYKGGRGNDGQFLLELFDGGSHTSLRLSGAREFRDSLVSITGCIQPEVLAKLVNASTGDADGRYARFLLAPLTQAPKPLPVAIDPEEQEAIDRAGQYLQEVADSIHRAPPVHLQLGPDALELFAQYEHRQARAAAAATIPAQGAVLGKSAGKVLRVAGLLHRLDGIANGTTGTTVGADPLLRAIDLVEHLNGWVLGLHADLTAGCEPTGLMRKIHDTARSVKKPLQWRQLRDRLGKRQAEEWGRDSFEAAIEALRALGVGRIESPDRGGLAYVPTGNLP